LTPLHGSRGRHAVVQDWDAEGVLSSGLRVRIKTPQPKVETALTEARVVTTQKAAVKLKTDPYPAPSPPPQGKSKDPVSKPEKDEGDCEGPATPLRPMEGFILPADKVRDFFKSKGLYPVAHGDEEVVVNYEGDRRLLTSRNVLEIKEPFRAKHVWATGYKWNKAIVAFIIAIAVAAFVAVQAALWWLVSTEVAFAMGWMPYIPLGTLTICVPTVAAIVILFTRRTMHVYYVPHLVSCLLLDFDRNVDHKTVVTNMRTKFRRFSGFPLPDEDAVPFMIGTEDITMYMMVTQDFYKGRARCFMQP